MLSLLFPLLVHWYFQSKLSRHLCTSWFFPFHISHLNYVEYSTFSLHQNYPYWRQSLWYHLFYPYICITEKKKISWVHNGLCFVIENFNKTLCIIGYFKSQIFGNPRIKFFHAKLHENIFTFVLDIFEQIYHRVWILGFVHRW